MQHLPPKLVAQYTCQLTMTSEGEVVVDPELLAALVEQMISSPVERADVISGEQGQSGRRIECVAGCPDYLSRPLAQSTDERGSQDTPRLREIFVQTCYFLD